MEAEEKEDFERLSCSVFTYTSRVSVTAEERAFSICRSSLVFSVFFSLILTVALVFAGERFAGTFGEAVAGSVCVMVGICFCCDRLKSVEDISFLDIT